MKILESFQNILQLPRAIQEAIVLIPLMVIINYVTDGPYWWKESFLMLMILYGFCWLIWRVVMTSIRWGSYGIVELLQPVRFLAATFIIMVCMNIWFPSNKPDRFHISEDVMASDCSEARWTVNISYDYNDGLLNSSDSFSVFGNTQEAQERATKMVEAWKEVHPSYKYTSHDIDLYYMPRKFCQEKHYPLFWSECKDPDKTSEKQKRD